VHFLFSFQTYLNVGLSFRNKGENSWSSGGYNF